jgi:hypothetical protein
MGRSPSSAKNREETWQDAFDVAGLKCDLASDSSVGRQLLDEYLKPDRHTKQPRIHFSYACGLVTEQMKRYSWDNYRTKDERGVKETPRPKYDDFPTLLKYVMNSSPLFSVLRDGAPILKRTGTRSKGY